MVTNLLIMVKRFVDYLKELQKNAQNEMGEYEQPEYEFQFNHTI